MVTDKILLGFELFDVEHPYQIFIEHKKLRRRLFMNCIDIKHSKNALLTYLSRNL